MGDTPNPQDQPDSEPASGSENASFSQDDIDALMSGDAEDQTKADSAPVSDESSESSEISQSDIDALMGSAGEADSKAEATTPTAEQGDGEPQLDTLGRPFDEAAAAMQAAIAEEQAESASSATATATVAPPPPDAKPLDLPDLETTPVLEIDPKKVTMLNDVNLLVKIELGRTRMLVEEVLALDEGSVVELDKLAGDPVDVYVNDRLVARGEVLVLNDSFCIRINDVLSHDPHRIIS